jgi:selenide, water dikinase
LALAVTCLEMANASDVRIVLDAESVPVLNRAMELIAMGMLPAGSFANKKHCSLQVKVNSDVNALRVDMIFDAQTSGGLVLGVAEALVPEAQRLLREGGELSEVIGRVVPYQPGEPRLDIV